MTPSLKLTYFDLKGRAEATRLALHVGGVAFDDVRISFSDFDQAMKDTLPFGQLPTLEIDGKVYAQSEAMLRYAGRLTGLYPDDILQALEVDMILNTVEDMVSILLPSMYEEDKSKVPGMRAKTVEKWGKFFTALNGRLASKNSKCFVGDKLTIADLLTYVNMSWFTSGVLDHIPTNILDGYPALQGLVSAVDSHPRVAEWNKMHTKA